MELSWAINSGTDPFAAAVGDHTQYTIHFSEFNGTSDNEVQQAINACVDRACELLEKNIRDDSRYLLFEWDVVYSMLTIVVTDDAKEKDSQYVVKCQLTAIDKKLTPENTQPNSEWESRVSEFAEDVQYWIKDYLTTCAPFLNYSLIAAFHRESRASCTLL
ncbi:hypothetical protein M0G74_08970 [Microbulbifer sp. CAU 1566]|uniref:hypothetical protein n=1 Tax=Microbulbifer sp. CAU 1566 TaxID=2933269 RepID=UPI0020067DE5|nr:hypothetical protein [Microbulbifer sp. CAU 1566]MCK7597397.1 hypothetical protein [Microbulbifer sp. CAU 1566]